MVLHMTKDLKPSDDENTIKTFLLKVVWIDTSH